MIIRVVEQCLQSSAHKVVVATDDERIAKPLIAYGAEVHMTSDKHLNGSSRCAEVLTILQNRGESYDWLINVQGDEPFIDPKAIDELISAGNESHAAVLTRLIEETAGQVQNPNVVKAVIGTGKGKSVPVLYFSRAVIPYIREKGLEATFYRHIGIYAFKCSRLHELTALPPSKLESVEHLEQLRWLENGYAIEAVIAKDQDTAPAVDHPDDLIHVDNFLKTHPHLK